MLKRLLLVLLLALTLRITYVAAVTRHDHHLYDAFWYTIGADMFAQGKGPVVPVFTHRRRTGSPGRQLCKDLQRTLARLVGRLLWDTGCDSLT